MRNALIDSGYSVYTAEAITAASEDATTAHRWMVQNAADLQLDTTRIAVGGLSAGAITSLNLAYCLDDFGIVDLPEIGAVIDLAGALYEFVDHMETGEAPLIIVHGEADTVVDFSHGEALAAQALAVLSAPPPTVAVQAVAVLLPPPPMVAAHPLAVLSWPPLMVE